MKMERPERVRTFLWLMNYGRLMTADKKARMIGISPYCHNCLQVKESILYMLRDCPSASRIWAKIVHPNAITLFFTMPLELWV
ncbi:hypothetical protein AHAS_Ahas02G0213800 [Arachis hypogaea]